MKMSDNSHVNIRHTAYVVVKELMVFTIARFHCHYVCHVRVDVELCTGQDYLMYYQCSNWGAANL